MTKVSSRVALLAVVSVLTAVPPVFAATQANGNNNSNASMQIDCTVQANLSNPLCAPSRPNRGPTGTNGPTGSSLPSMQPGGSNGPNGNNGPHGPNGGPPNGPPPGYKGPPSGTFNFNPQDRRYFDSRFHGMNFGNFSFFATIPFQIAIGTLLPSPFHTHLRPVPYSVYRYYPWFRGYDYFIDRNGDFVIVSPRTFRIVAVL